MHETVLLILITSNCCNCI